METSRNNSIDIIIKNFSLVMHLNLNNGDLPTNYLKMTK